MKYSWLALIFSAIAGIAFVLYFDSNYLPELRYFSRVAEISDAWETRLRTENRPCYIIAGGSEIRAGINPDVMLEKHNLPVINAGEHAGFGISSNASLALRYLKKGDTLVLSIVGVTDNEVLPQKNGIKLIRLRYTPEIKECGLIKPTYKNLSRIFLGSYGQYVLTFSGMLSDFRKNKDWKHQPYYYDTRATIHPSGWMNIHENKIGKNANINYSLKEVDFISDEDEIMIVLHKLREWTKQKGIHFLVHLPVRYYTSEDKRIQNAIYALQLTQKGIPVLKDERLGVMTDENYFSDTRLHLSETGTRENSEIIAKALKNNHIWSKNELIVELSKKGRNADGTCIK